MTDPTSLTPEPATQALADMAKEYRAKDAAPFSSEEAGAKLSELAQDQIWREKFLLGDVAARREFDRLTALKAALDTHLDSVGAQPEFEIVDGVTDPNAVPA